MLLKKIKFCQYCSILKRHINVEASPNENPLKNISPRSHIYRRASFSNHKELAAHLLNNVVYRNNDLIVLNKPYGLKKTSTKLSNNETQIAIHPSVSHIDHLNFNDSLPHISEHLNVNALEAVKLPERYMSGVSFLSASQNTKNMLRKALSNTQEPYTYLCVCVGIPKETEKSMKLGLTYVSKGTDKKTIFVDSYSKRAREKQLAFPFFVHQRILSVNEELNISLVQLKVNRNRWNCLRLYCATKLLAPCLGDGLMASRIKRINNVPVVVDPFSPVTNFPQKLPSNILSAIMIRNNDERSIPLHMHLVQVDLKKYRQFGITFIAKPPEHFLWSCERLGISVPEYYLQNCDLPITNSFTAVDS